MSYSQHNMPQNLLPQNKICTKGLLGVTTNVVLPKNNEIWGILQGYILCKVATAKTGTKKQEWKISNFLCCSLP